MSLIIQNLEFYDHNGIRQSATLSSSNVWNFELDFDSISTDLFSTQQIHVMERAINILNGESKPTLIYPKTTESESIKFKFKNRNYDNFFLYRIKYSSNISDYYVESVSKNKNLDLQTKPDSKQTKSAYANTFVSGNVTLSENEIYPTISKVANSFSIGLETTIQVGSANLVSNTSTSYLNSNNLREVYQYDNGIDAPTMNIGFISSSSGEFKEYLEIYVSNTTTDTLIANVTLFAEAESKDERFVTILENFGQSLNLDDSLVFRDTDVNDDGLDYKIVNEKSKELILEYQNIIPYIGSYKGLINALKFYGYGDLKLKEWWLNSETEKIYHLNVNTETYKTERLKEQDFLENKNLKRTGKFSLYYNINQPNGELDSNGIPELENVFQYSQEEVLIKLYGLKELLKNKYLPLSTRIMDITGEGITFNRISTTSWNTPVTIQEINNLNININVEALPKIGTLHETYLSGYNANTRLDTLSDIYNQTISQLALKRLDNANNYTIQYDSPNRRSYEDVNITNKTFLQYWNDSNFPWEDGDKINWEDVNGHPFYELSWVITKNTGVPFFKKISGNVSDMTSVNVEVTSSGEYDVTLYMKDLYNNVFVNRYENLFSVELPEPRFGVVYNNINQISNWQEAGQRLLNWSESTFDWRTNLLSDQKWEDSNSTWDSLDPNKYMGQKTLRGQKRFSLDSIKRDEQYVTIKNISDSDYNMANTQTFLTFVEDSILPFIPPKTITEANSTLNTLKISGNSEPVVGDLVEVFQYQNFSSFTLSSKILTIPSAINIKNGLKIHLKNSTTDVVLIADDYKIDDRLNTTSITLKDTESILYGKTFTEVNICWDFRTYDVIDKQTSGSSTILTIESSVEANVDIIEDILETSTMGLWWNIISGKYSVPISSIISSNIQNGKRDIQINLIDSERELFRVSKNFDVIFAEYDINKAEGRASKTEINWEDLDNSKWGSTEHLNWDVCELWPSLLTGFYISNITGGGRIKIDNSEYFQFTSHCTGNVTLAVNELSTSTIPAFKNYDYYAVNSNVIHATSKTWGEETLSVIEYIGGLGIEPSINPRYATNYPLPNVVKQEPNYELGTKNNRLLSNRLIRDWDYIDENVEIEKDKSDIDLYIDDDINETFKQNMAYSTNGIFRWENTKFSEDSVIIPNNTICYFYGDISKDIIGKTKYNWKIYDDSDVVLAELEGSNISYFFKDIGNFSVELEVTDGYGNTSVLKKLGMVNTY